MTQIERIVDELTRMHGGDAWHGPSLRELLGDMTAEAASARPVAGAHSAWELVLHITAWESVVLRRLRGEHVEPSAEEDWPAVAEAGDAAWRRALDAMEESRRELSAEVAALSEASLDDTVPGKDHSVGIMLDGLIQHDAYHAGQIALLRRAQQG